MNKNMAETKTGFLDLRDASLNRHVRLMMVAYTRVSDPFVVFYSDSAWMWKKPCAFLKLKTCIVTENSEVSFTLTPQGERIGNSTGMLCFTAESPKEKEEWVRVLKDIEREDEKTVKKINRGARKSRILPAIEESFTEEIAVIEPRRSSLIPAV